MEKKIVITSRFNYSDFNLSNNYNHTNPLNPEWIKNRMKIFMQYTRKSLEGQTNQNFIACLSAFEESMPLINELLKDYPPLPDNIIFTSCKEKIIADYIKDGDVLYLVRIDSDDMYIRTHIQKLFDYEPKPTTSCLICQSGYTYFIQEDRFAHYNITSPPFYTQIFTVQDYLDVYQYYPEVPHNAMSSLPYEPILDKSFIVIVHGHNIWNSERIFNSHSLITNPTSIETIRKNFYL